MKIIFAMCFTALLSIGYFIADPITIHTSNNLPKAVNPLKDSKELVESVKAQPMDFSELNRPFSSDSIDTEIAGLIRTDANGDLIIDGEFKSFIDYFLSSVGHVTPEQALNRMRLHIYDQLPLDAAQQAMEVLENYLAFKEYSFDALAEAVDSERSEVDAHYRFEKLQQGLQTLYDLRRTHLGEHVASALFYEDEAYAQYTITNMAMDLNSELTAEERENLKVAARSQLPSEMADIIFKQEQQAVAMQKYSDILTSNPSKVDMQTFAYENFDADTATQIIEDYEVQLRLQDSYIMFKKDIANIDEQDISDIEKQSSIERIAMEYYTEEEFSKIKAWQLAEIRH